MLKKPKYNIDFKHCLCYSVINAEPNGKIMNIKTNFKRFTTPLLLAGALSLSSTANAQIIGQKDEAKDNKTTPSYISLGPTVSFGHSWMSNTTNTTFKPSAALGVSIMYSRYEHWGWGATLAASHEGFANRTYVNGNEYVNIYDPTYIRFTPRAYYFFGKYGQNVRPKIYAGPSVGYRATEDIYINEPASNEVVSVDMPRDMYRNFDFGADVGVGVNVKVMKNAWLNLDANYYHGLVDVTTANTNNQNRSLRGNVGLLFGL